jgi:signal transduction histidine kinase/DNA-binding response OmpR family regulator
MLSRRVSSGPGLKAAPSSPGRSQNLSERQFAQASDISETESTNVATAIRLVRIAGLILFLSQPIRLVSQLKGGSQPLPEFVYYYHGFNATVTLLALALTWTRWFRRWWEAISFALCLLMVASVSVISVLDQSGTERLFASLMLLVFGTALLVPWTAAWQASLNITVLVDMTISDALVSTNDAAFSVHWVSLLVAVALAQSAASFMRRSRAQRLDIRRLTESEERLQREVIQREQAQKQLSESLSELRRIQSDLIRAREQAMAALQAKSEFLSSISHEIRTPMNVILGMADVLSETPLSREQRQHLETMRANGKLLLDLINSVLDLALIESGRLELEQIEFDLPELAERAVETLAVAAHGKGLELAARIQPDVPVRLVGDPLRLHQVLLNLLSNAIKFTEQGGVLLSVSRSGSADNGTCRIHFAVADTGIGIPRDKVNVIFLHFTQVDSSTTRRHGGSGLGLAIVKRLVELMHGTVWVESEVGQGSVFHVELSLPMSPSSDVQVQDASLHGLRILVADQATIDRTVLRELLGARGCEVDEARSVAEITEKIQNAASIGKPYQCLLVDVRILEAAGILRDQARDKTDGVGLWAEAVRAIPMLTTDNLNVKLARLRAAGLNTWLIKPIKRLDLFSVIAEAAGQQRLLPKPAEEAPAAQAVPAERPLRILLAEDSADNRMLIQIYLRDRGHQLDFAENGEVAVKKFMSSCYDVVLMDHQMPVMDGYAAVRAIRKWEHEQGRAPTAVIALTASAFSVDVQASLEAGCDAHVSKPVKKDVLLRALSEVTRTQIRPLPTPSRTDDAASAVEVSAELKELVPGFLANKRRDIVLLRAALGRRDYAGLQRLGHTLKGEGGSYGFDAISELGAELEQAARQNDAQAVEELIASLSRYLDSVSVVYR